MKIKWGQKVTIGPGEPIEAFYSGYAGLPQAWFKPGMVGLIVDPDVCDNKVCVDFYLPGVPQRFSWEQPDKSGQYKNNVPWRVKSVVSRLILLPDDTEIYYGGLPYGGGKSCNFCSLSSWRELHGVYLRCPVCGQINTFVYPVKGI